MNVTEWTTPQLVRQFAECKMANVLGRRTMNVTNYSWYEGQSHLFLWAVVDELRSRGVLDMH